MDPPHLDKNGTHYSVPATLIYGRGAPTDMAYVVTNDAVMGRDVINIDDNSDVDDKKNDDYNYEEEEDNSSSSNESDINSSTETSAMKEDRQHDRSLGARGQKEDHDLNQDTSSHTQSIGKQLSNDDDDDGSGYAHNIDPYAHLDAISWNRNRKVKQNIIRNKGLNGSNTIEGALLEVSKAMYFPENKFERYGYDTTRIEQNETRLNSKHDRSLLPSWFSSISEMNNESDTTIAKKHDIDGKSFEKRKRKILKVGNRNDNEFESQGNEHLLTILDQLERSVSSESMHPLIEEQEEEGQEQDEKNDQQPMNKKDTSTINVINESKSMHYSQSKTYLRENEMKIRSRAARNKDNKSKSASYSTQGIVYARLRVISIDYVNYSTKLEVLHRKSKIKGIVLLYDSWRATHIQQGDTINIVWSDILKPPSENAVTSNDFTQSNEPSGSHSLSARYFLEQRLKQNGNGILAIISDEQNYLITRPDELIPVKVLSHSHDCSRKGVLSGRFASEEISKNATILSIKYQLLENVLNFLKENDYMAEGLDREINNLKSFILKNPENLKRLYSVALSTEQINHELEVFIPGLMNWIYQYLLSKEQFLWNVRNENDELIDHKVTIEKIISSKENVWSSMWGLKDDIDALFLIQVDKNVEGREMVYSLSPVIVTSNSYLAPEDVTRSLLCSLLVYDRYYQLAESLQKSFFPKLDSSLGLLFLTNNSDDIINQFQTSINLNRSVASVQIAFSSRKEIQKCIQSRNWYASNIPKTEVSGQITAAIISNLSSLNGQQDLQSSTSSYSSNGSLVPPVIGNIDGICSTCSHRDLCMLYHFSMEKGTYETSGLSEAEFMNAIRRCRESHAHYFNTWNKLLELEEKADYSFQSEMWLLQSPERENIGRCLSNMALVNSSHHGPNNFVYEFTRHKDSKRKVPPTASQSNKTQVGISNNNNNTLSQRSYISPRLSQSSQEKLPISKLTLGCGDLVVIGIEESHIAACTGTVIELNEYRVVIKTSLPLFVPNRSEFLLNGSEDIEDIMMNMTQNDTSLNRFRWRIDKDEACSEVYLARKGLLSLFAPEAGVGSFYFNDVKNETLRDLLIDLQAPSFCDHFEQPGFRFLRDATSHVIANALQYVNTVQALRDKLLDVDYVLPETQPENMELRLALVEKIISFNREQTKALCAVLATNNYSCIRATSGTGKGTILAVIALVLYLLGNSVLITANSHSAVDNLLLKIREFGVNNFIRLGKTSQVNLHVRSNSLDHETSSPQLMERINDLDKNPNIIIGATFDDVIRHPVIIRKRFDYCIVDESEQVIQPICVAPLSISNKFILIGDHICMSPTVKSEKAKEMGISKSLFSVLANAHGGAVITLTDQYRMNSKILLLANELIYQYPLKCADSFVENGLLRLINYPSCLYGLESFKVKHINPEWLSSVLNPQNEVVFLDTDGARDGSISIDQIQMKSLGYSNSGDVINSVSTQNDSDVHFPNQNAIGPMIHTAEACIIRDVVLGLVLCGIAYADIGVVALSRSQLRRIRNSLAIDQNNYPLLEVECIDKYQGKEKRCIIASLARSNSDMSTEALLQDWQSLNIIFSKAKCKLIVIGSGTILRSNPISSRFVNFADHHHWTMKVPGHIVQSYGLNYSSS